MSRLGHGVADARTFFHSVKHSPGLGRLLAVRLTSQIADGIFQAGLVGAIVFNPERHTDPLAVAGGLAVLLLPYSLIGPFAGALLDHWDRRSVLMTANIARAVLVGLVALAIATGAGESVILIGALAVTGASRFVAAGLSAGLPHVTTREVIVAVNAVFTTLGAAMLVVGTGIVLALRAIFGDDNLGSAISELGGVVMALVAAAIAYGFGRLQLGPDHPDDPGSSALHAVAVGLWHGVRAVGRSSTVSAALSAIGMHRLVFGMNTLMLLVFSRHIDDAGDGLGIVSVIAGCTAGGALLAAIVTPVAVAKVGRRTTLICALCVGAVAQSFLLTFTVEVFYVAAVVLGLVGQTVKLCGDVAMQLDVPDWVRGQVFSVQDAIFNVAYVCAVTIAALTVPADGRTMLLPLLGVGLYVLGVIVVRVIHPKTAPLGPGTETARSPGPMEVG